MLFSVTFRRTGDGPVQISGVDVLPTWVNLYRDGDRDVFQIVPLDTAKDWRTAFDLDRPAAGPANAENSYERTWPWCGTAWRPFGLLSRRPLETGYKKDTFVGYTVVGGDGYD